MMDVSSKIEKLISAISKLPGIGPKSAERIALYLLSMEDYEIKDFLETIEDAKEHIKLCPICFNITDSEICNICSSSRRDHSVVCVIEEVRDLFAIEKGGEYNGVYHVLHGKIDPINHISQEDLKIKELIERVARNEIKEVIIATNPNFSGDLTATYLKKILTPFGAKVTRIATGLPKGAEIDFVDSVTLSLAIKERKEA
ncbi:MAG: recombination mediator RecR [Caldiserica bacterium]|nr:recombination mediator RecR [Caldisericota bacterium]